MTTRTISAIQKPVIAAELTYLDMRKPRGDQKYSLKPNPNA